MRKGIWGQEPVLILTMYRRDFAFALACRPRPLDGPEAGW